MIRRRRMRRNEIIEVPQEEVLLNELLPTATSPVNIVLPNEVQSENEVVPKELSDYINSLVCCIECTRPILDGEKKAEYECGCHTVHFKCALQGAYNAMRDHRHFSCITCGVVLFGDANRVNDNEEAILLVDNLEALKKTKPFKADLKIVKAKHTAYNKASTIFKKILTQEFKKYENLVTASILTIKHAKKTAFDALRLTDEYKNVVKAATVSTSSCNRFKTKYNLGWQESQILKIAAISNWRRFRSRPKSLMYRKFRLRI